MYSVFLSSFSINLLAFYHECRSLSTHVLFCDKIVSSVAAGAGAASLCFRSAHEADLEDNFERLEDLY